MLVSDISANILSLITPFYSIYYCQYTSKWCVRYKLIGGNWSRPSGNTAYHTRVIIKENKATLRTGFTFY